MKVRILALGTTAALATAALAQAPASSPSNAAAGSNSPTVSASPSPSPERNLRNFAAPIPIYSPAPAEPQLSPFAENDVWAHLVGKSFRDVLFEADQAYEHGDFKRAAEIASYALQMPLSKEQAALATMHRGNAYAAAGDLDHALRDLNESLTLDPRNPGGYVNRALVLRRQGDNAGAQKDYQEALRIDPRNWQAYFNLGRDALEDGDLPAALNNFDKVIALRHDFVYGYVGRAAVRLRQHDDAAANKDLATAAKLDPGALELYLFCATAAAREKKYRAAEEEIARALKKATGKREVLLNSIAWFRATSPDEKLRNGAEAVRLATEACELTSWQSWQPIDTLAAAYAAAGDFEKAQQFEKRALGFNLGQAFRLKAGERLELYQQHKPYLEDPTL